MMLADLNDETLSFEARLQLARETTFMWGLPESPRTAK
jgi:hypothetical protein